jgi:hypothetical protein
MEEITEQQFLSKEFPIMSINIDSQGIKYFKEDQ